MLLYPELVTSTLEAEGAFFCTVQLGQGFAQCSTTRFGSGRCPSTLELATSSIRAEGMFLYEVSPGVLLLDMAADGAFVFWSIQPLLWRLKGCSSEVA